MEIDPALAASLGFPKLKYAWVEHERRWLCAAVPVELVRQSEAITDLCVTGTQLRLREARPLDGSPSMRRLGRKVDVDSATRLLTSIYLTEGEFALLSGLPGALLKKTRHRLDAPEGVVLCVDEFHGALQGLVLAEAEFPDPQALAAFPQPPFAIREVTDDVRYTGGALATRGMPE